MYVLYYVCHTIPTCLPRSAAGKIYHANLPPDFDGNKSWTVVEEDVIPWATCPGNNTTATEGVNNPNYCNPAVSLNLLFLFYTPPPATRITSQSFIHHQNTCAFRCTKNAGGGNASYSPHTALAGTTTPKAPGSTGAVLQGWCCFDDFDAAVLTC